MAEFELSLISSCASSAVVAVGFSLEDADLLPSLRMKRDLFHLMQNGSKSNIKEAGGNNVSVVFCPASSLEFTWSFPSLLFNFKNSFRSIYY